MFFFFTPRDSGLTPTGSVTMRRLESRVGALSHKMTRNQTSLLDLVGRGLLYFGADGGGGDVTVRGWLQKRAGRPASSGPLGAANSHRGGS